MSNTKNNKVVSTTIAAAKTMTAAERILQLEAKLSEYNKDWNQLEGYVQEINSRTSDTTGKPLKRIWGFLMGHYGEIIPIVKLIIKLILKNSKNTTLKNNLDTILN